MPSGWTEGEKRKRYDLVFQCCPPPPRPAPTPSHSSQGLSLWIQTGSVFTQHYRGVPEMLVPLPSLSLLHPPVTITPFSPWPPCVTSSMTSFPPSCRSHPCFSSAAKTQMVSRYGSTDFVTVRSIETLQRRQTWSHIKVQVFAFWLIVRRNLTYISKETMKWKFAVMCVFTVAFHPCVKALSLIQWLTPSTKVGSVLRNRLFKKKKKKKTFSVCCHRWKLSLPDNIINNSYMTNTFTSQPPSDKRIST